MFGMLIELTQLQQLLVSLAELLPAPACIGIDDKLLNWSLALTLGG